MVKLSNSYQIKESTILRREQLPGVCLSFINFCHSACALCECLYTSVLVVPAWLHWIELSSKRSSRSTIKTRMVPLIGRKYVAF